MHKYLGGDNIISRVTHTDTNGKGGYRTLATIKERDEILEEQLSLGMLVYVQSEGAEYRLESLEPITWNIQKIQSISIDDSTTSGAKVWSSLKTSNEITKAKTDIISTAPDTLNTLAKLAAAINNNPFYFSYIEKILSSKLNSADTYTKTEIENSFAAKSKEHLHNNLETLQAIQTIPNDKTKILLGDGSWDYNSVLSWGQIHGDINSQLDLKNKLDYKSDILHNHDSRYLAANALTLHNLQYDHRDIHYHLNKDFLDTLTPEMIASGGHTIQDNGTDLTQRTNLNLIGFTVTDDEANDATKVSLADPVPTLIAFTPEMGLVPNKLVIRLYFNTDMDADTINSTNIILRKKV
jgi:hypothetical protein